MKNKFKIGFFGDEVWAHNCLRFLLNDKSLDIKFICGRYKTKDKKLKKIAEKNKIKFYKEKNINNVKFLKILKKEKLDLLVSMSFDQIFKKKIINLVNKKIINCHAGKLPFYRGRNVLNWALINGEKEFGITTHFISKKIDEGDVIMQKRFLIKRNDDYSTLLRKSHKECAKILFQTIKKIQSKRFKSVPQKRLSKNFSYFKKRIKGDEIINLKQKSFQIKNFVKALVEPGPLARLKLKNNNQILIKKVSILRKKSLISQLSKKNLKLINKKLYFKSIDLKIIRIDAWKSIKPINSNFVSLNI